MAGQKKKMVGGQKNMDGWMDKKNRWMVGWMDRKKIERWLDGYKNGWMVRWIHYFNVWIEQIQVNSWKDEKKIIYIK